MVGFCYKIHLTQNLFWKLHAFTLKIRLVSTVEQRPTPGLGMEAFQRINMSFCIHLANPERGLNRSLCHSYWKTLKVLYLGCRLFGRLLSR